MAGLVLKAVSRGATREESEAIGEATRAFAGNLRSSVRAEKRRWTVQVYVPTEAEFATLLAATANRAFVTCTGTLLQNASITCMVTVGRTDFHKKTITSLWCTTSLAIVEV